MRKLLAKEEEERRRTKNEKVEEQIQSHTERMNTDMIKILNRRK
jgi:hypothetical protein